MVAEENGPPTGARKQKSFGCFGRCCLLPQKQAVPAEVGREITLTPSNSPKAEESSPTTSPTTDVINLQGEFAGTNKEATSSDVAMRKGLSSCSTAVHSTDTDQILDSKDISKETAIPRGGHTLALPKIMSNAAMMAQKSSPKSSQAATTPSGTPLQRKRDALRNATRHITGRLTLKLTKFYRSKSSLASRRLPAPVKPTTPSLTTHEMQVSVPDLRAALMRTSRCPMIKFLKKVGGCHDFSTTAWEEGGEHTGTKVRKCSYVTPVPADVPAFARRLLSVPDEISTTTIWQLSGDEKELLLQQQSYCLDILYGDRFKVQNVIHFCEETEGVVTAKQWMEIVWEKPLPWTHGVVRHFIETKTKNDGLAFSGDLVATLQEAVSQLRHEEEEEGRSVPASSNPVSFVAESDGA